jgi:DUF1680 family protein
MLMYYVSLKPGLYKTLGLPLTRPMLQGWVGRIRKLTDSIYFLANDALYVNLFIASKLNWKERAASEPEDSGRTNDNATMEMPKAKTSLKIRAPYWAHQWRDGEGQRRDQQATATPSSYLDLDRTWANGDVVRSPCRCRSILPCSRR